MLLSLHFFLGIIISFFGMLVPSMLNMTAAKISIERGKSKAVRFALGASIIVFIQAYIATIFTQYLRDNQIFVQYLQKIAFLIFILLTLYFFRQYRQDRKHVDKTTKKDFKNTFVVGLLLSALNMFAIPFYCGITTALDVAGWFRFSQSYILFFVLGSGIGSFLLLYMYLNYAKVLQQKAAGFSKNLNLVLALITGILSLITLFKIL